MIYGLIKNGQIIQEKDWGSENPPILSEAKGMKWEPFPEFPLYAPGHQSLVKSVVNGKIVLTIVNKPTKQPTSFDNEMVSVGNKVKAFLQTKGISDTVYYGYTAYNVTTGQEISHVFSTGKYLIKVGISAPYDVLEWYENAVNFNGEKFQWVSRDKQDNSILEVYRETETGVDKFLNDGTTFIVSTVFGDFSTLPVEKQILLADFLYKNDIIMWSDKSYGFIVEYSKKNSIHNQ